MQVVARLQAQPDGARRLAQAGNARGGSSDDTSSDGDGDDDEQMTNEQIMMQGTPIEARTPTSRTPRDDGEWKEWGRDSQVG